MTGRSALPAGDLGERSTDSAGLLTYYEGMRWFQGPGVMDDILAPLSRKAGAESYDTVRLITVEEILWFDGLRCYGD
jgi:hypothetical protein